MTAPIPVFGPPPTPEIKDPELRFTGLPMDVSYFSGQDWLLKRDLAYRTRNCGTSTARAGFWFDFGSIPRFFWRWLMPPTGDRRNPAGYGFLFHDWLYTHQEIEGVPITRAVADAVLYEILRYLRCSGWKSWAIYRGVRLGGWVPWARRARARTEDGKRKTEDTGAEVVEHKGAEVAEPKRGGNAE